MRHYICPVVGSNPDGSMNFFSFLGVFFFGISKLLNLKYNTDATINFDIMWMRDNRKSAISVKLQPLKSKE